MLNITPRLKDYIMYATWPEDLADYLPSGEKHNNCIWCDSNGGNMIPYNLDPDRLDCMYNCCLKCKKDLDDNMMATVMNENMLRDIEDNVSIEKSKQDTAKDLMRYITDKQLPEVCFSYVFTGPNHDFCLFCDNTVQENQGWPIEVPSGLSHTHYGGTAQVCDKCNTYLMQSNVSLTHHVENLDRCISCHEDYAVSNAEKRQRIRFKSTKGHLCPYCFYTEMDKNWCSKIFESQECEVCKLSFPIDLTCKLANNLDTYFPHVYCNKCCKLSTDPGKEVILRLEDDHDYYIHIITHPIFKVSFLRYNTNLGPYKGSPVAIKHAINYSYCKDISEVAFKSTHDFNILREERLSNKQLNLPL